jgi:flagellar protein FliS
MSAQYVSSPRAYRENAVLTASPEQLVVMLYDGARRFLHQAAVAMGQRQIETAHNRLRRAESIIIHLRETLDLEKGGEIADGLYALYVFCQRHLNQARIDCDPFKIEKVSSLIGELREAWATVLGQ